LHNSVVEDNHAINATGGELPGVAGNLFIENTTVQSNTAYSYGGGIHTSQVTTIISNTRIMSNTILMLESSQFGGGGISFQNGLLKINDTILAGNQAPFGGGIFSFMGIILIQRGSINNNYANKGGGIYVTQPYVTLEAGNIEISDNSAITGGGIYLENGATINLVDSILENNVAELKGGAVLANQGLLNLIGSTIINNHAVGTGGGFHIYSSTVSIEQSSIAYNGGVVAGGGIHIVDGNLKIESSTISENQASQWGNNISSYGALITATNMTTYSGFSNTIESLYSDNSDWTFINTVIQGRQRSCVFEYSNVNSFGGNMDDDGSCQLSGVIDFPHAIFNLNLIIFDKERGFYHPRTAENQLLLDRGINAVCSATDQFGISRPIDGNGDGASICDIGAVEYLSVPTSITQVTVSTATFSINEFIVCYLGLFLLSVCYKKYQKVIG
jgi:predicted outer membrane repeat protein